MPVQFFSEQDLVDYKPIVEKEYSLKVYKQLAKAKIHILKHKSLKNENADVFGLGLLNVAQKNFAIFQYYDDKGFKFYSENENKYLKYVAIPCENISASLPIDLKDINRILNFDPKTETLDEYYHNKVKDFLINQGLFKLALHNKIKNISEIYQ